MANQIPTGIAPLDLILGGGIPRNRVIEIFGPPGSFKSTLAYLIVASKQHISPELRCAWIAVEPFDPKWAAKFGVDVEKLVVIRPTYAEQVVEISEALMLADDCGLVVLDSFAAMVTREEKGNSKSDAGSSAVVAKRLVNKVVAAQRRAGNNGCAPTFVLINQIRYRGVFGETTTPGGFAPKHAAAIRLRLDAKDICDKQANKGLPAKKEVRVVVEKATISVAARECIFEIAMLNQPGLQVGQVNDNWKTLPAGFPE
jgi:recombination protein RecA